MSGPRRLSFGDDADTSTEQSGPRRVGSRNPSSASHPSTYTNTGPRRLSVPTEHDISPLSDIEVLINKATSIDTSLEPMRIKGRIQTIVDMSVTDILNWGERNLAPLRDVSNAKAKIASDMSRINAFGWLQEAKDASSKSKSFFDRLSNKTPSYYEGMLKKARSEMLAFVAELEKMKKEFKREVTDLHLDALALTVCYDVFPDDNTKMCAQERAKTLTMAHQTAAMLFTTIEQSLSQCAKAAQQIDSFMAVTMPNWKMANE